MTKPACAEPRGSRLIVAYRSGGAVTSVTQGLTTADVAVHARSGDAEEIGRTSFRRCIWRFTALIGAWEAERLAGAGRFQVTRT